MARAAGFVELDPEWRSRAQATQQVGMPGGRVAVSCPAPFGAGGLGRHVREIVEALWRSDAVVTYACEAGEAHATTRAGVGGPGAAREVTPSRARAIALSAVTRFSPPVRMWAALVEFDRLAARALGDPAAEGFEHLIAFNGAALHQMQRARASALRPSLRLVSATAHIRAVVRQHERAYRQYPLERSWASRVVARTLAEYEGAQVIYVSSQRVRESFLAEGVAPERLVEFPLTPDPRFTVRREGGSSGADAFEIVYVGGLSVVKGVPLLVDAFARLDRADMRLVLVGGYGTRGMRRFIERARARDERIVVTLGDPLEHLRRASLYVHPSYDDGFGYSPAEALAAPSAIG